MTTPNTLPANGGVSDAAKQVFAAAEALAAIQLPNHEPTIAIEELLKAYDPEDAEAVWESITAYADAHARAAVAQSRPPSTQSAGVVATADPRPWDHVDDVLPVIELMRSGKWAWVENMRCKYIELRIDTRDGGCIIRDREKVRITPQQLANQPYGGHGEPWAPPPAGGGKEALSDAERRYEFLRQDAGIRDGRPFIAISEAGAISQWTGVFADEKIDAAIRAGKKG